MDEITKKVLVDKIGAYMEAEFRLFHIPQSKIREVAGLIIDLILEVIQRKP